MQQYYETDSHTLTVFHTPSGDVSFDVEHFGTAVLQDTEKLKDLLNRSSGTIEFQGRSASPSEKTRDLARDTGNRSKGKITRQEDGATVKIEGYSYGEERTIKLCLSERQFEKLIKSIGSGDETVGYDVEFVEQ